MDLESQKEFIKSGPLRELRFAEVSDIHIEERDEGKQTVAGYAALFNSDSQLLYNFFTESIAPGAFKDSLARGDDVRALVDHNPSLIVGRNKAGTLRLTEDSKGLFVEITPPNTSVGKDLIENLRLGNVSQMSFGFTVQDSEWITKNGKDHRILKRVNLFDVSVVTYPAYTETSVGLRSAIEATAKEGREILAKLEADRVAAETRANRYNVKKLQWQLDKYAEISS